jgi:HlyD family secretion protein
MPGHTFSGTVTRSAMALDPNSRTMLVQADVANPDHLLHPGLYAEVTFEIPRTHPGVVVPSDAVLFDSAGLHVDVIDADNRVHQQKITIYRDFGTSVELASGLSGGERIALQPPAGTADGQVVQPVTAPAGKGAAPEPTQAKS